MSCRRVKVRPPRCKTPNCETEPPAFVVSLQPPCIVHCHRSCFRPWTPQRPTMATVVWGRTRSRRPRAEPLMQPHRAQVWAAPGLWSVSMSLAGFLDQIFALEWHGNQYMCCEKRSVVGRKWRKVVTEADRSFPFLFKLQSWLCHFIGALVWLSFAPSSILYCGVCTGRPSKKNKKIKKLFCLFFLL